MRASTAGKPGRGKKRRQPDPTPVAGALGLTTVLGVASTPPLISLLLGSLRPSSRALPAPGPFLRFSLARMDDSRSGKGGISSSTVACGVRDRCQLSQSRGGEGGQSSESGGGARL